MAIVGNRSGDIRPLLGETWRKYIPNKVVRRGFEDDSEAAQVTPLLGNRPLINLRLPPTFANISRVNSQ